MNINISPALADSQPDLITPFHAAACSSIPVLNYGLQVVGPSGSGKSQKIVPLVLNSVIPTGAGAFIAGRDPQMVELVKEAAAAAGRLEDVVVIGPKHGLHWNPVWQPDLPVTAIADQLIDLQPSLGKSDDKFMDLWQKRLMTAALSFSRDSSADGYFTLTDVAALLARVSAAGAAAKEDVKTESTTAELKCLVEADFGDFVRLPEKWQGAFMDSCLSIIDQIRNDEALVCSKAELTSLDFDQLYADNKIIVLDLDFETNPVVSKLIAIQVKAAFQRRIQNVVAKHPFLMLFDEYTSFVTPSTAYADGLIWENAVSWRVMPVLLWSSTEKLIKGIGEYWSDKVPYWMRTKIEL